MRQRLAGGETVDAVVDPASEQDREAVDRPARLGEMIVKRVEPPQMAFGERVEPRMKTGEGLAMGGQDEQVGRERAELRDRLEPVAERIGLGLADPLLVDCRYPLQLHGDGD